MSEYARRFERWQQQNPTGDLRSSFHLFPLRPCGGLSLEVETMILWAGLLPECSQCHIAHLPEEDELRHSPEFLPPPEEIELRRLWHQGGELVSSEQKRLMVAQAQNTSPLVLNSGFYQPGTRRFTPDVTARLLRVTDPSIVPVLPGPTPEQLLRADSEREKTRADAAEARADAAEARADASDIVVEQLQQRVSELYQEFIRSNETAAQTVAQTVAHKDRTIASTTAEWQGKLSGAQQAYQKALQDVKDLNAVDASEHITRIRELEQAANASAAAHAADIDRINSDHTEERQTMVKKMNENMGDIVTEMTLAKSEAVKAGRQALVDQNQVLSKEVLRLRASLTSKADEYANNIQNLMALYQKQTNELNETKSKAAENKRFLLESYAQSLNFWDTSFRAKEQQLRKQLQDKESEVRNRDSEINEIKEQHMAALKVKSDQVTELNEKHVSELKVKDDEIAKLKKQHLSDLKAKDDQLTELKEQHLSELKAKDDTLAELKKQHLSELKAKDDSLTELQRQHVSDLKAKNNEISSLSAGFQHALQELDKKRLSELKRKDDEIAALKASHLEEMNEVKARHLEEIQTLHREHLSALTAKEKEHAQEITKLQASHNQAIDDLGKAHGQALETQAEHHFYLREARVIEERARVMEHLAELAAKDQQHETSTQDLIRQHETSTDELVCQREESLYELKLKIGRLQERVDAREEQHEFALVEQANGYEFALVEQANGYEYHIQVEAAAFAHDFESQANQYRNALRLERQAHQGIVARDRGSYLRALAVDEGCHERAMELEQDAHERAIALERDATRLEKQRHFKLMQFCSMLGEHVDCLFDGSERLNEENERLQEQVRDGFRFESNMDDLENTVECMETRLLDEFNVVKQVVQPHLTSQTLVDEFTALKNVVESGVTSQTLVDDFAALKNVVESGVTSQALAADFTALKTVVETRVDLKLADNFTALKNMVETRVDPKLADNFTALKNMVETRVTPQLADNFTALKTVVESRIASQQTVVNKLEQIATSQQTVVNKLDQTVVDKLDKLKGLVEPNARKMESFGQAMEAITTKLDNMPVGAGAADLKEMAAERDGLIQQLNDLYADPRLEDVPSLDELFEEMGNDKAVLKLPPEIKAMGEVDLVGALANSIKRFKDDKNDLAGRVHGIQVLCACIDKVDTLRSGSGNTMTSSILKLGQEWIAQPAHEPEVATARELYTAWHFELSRRVSTLRRLAKALRQDKEKKKET